MLKLIFQLRQLPPSEFSKTELQLLVAMMDDLKYPLRRNTILTRKLAISFAVRIALSDELLALPLRD
jgi:hypothetical protein